MKFGHHNFRRTSLGFMFIVKLDAGRYAPSIINNGNGVVRVNYY